MSNITIRASSWAGLFDCAYRWEGEQILGIRKPSGMRALLGTSIHAGTALFDQSRLERSGATLRDATDELVRKLHDPGFEVDSGLDDLTITEAKKIGQLLVADYCSAWSPRYQFVAVEMIVEPLTIDCGGGVTVTLTGTLDRSRIKTGSEGEGISDLKTGGTAVQKGMATTKGRAPQIGTYELLYEHTLKRAITAPAEIIGMKTRGKPEIAEGRIVGAKAMMVGNDEHPGLIQYAADMLRSGNFYPNPSSLLCGEKYCARWPRCAFHA
ncbi:PD-(D/E)XK nuclease family protein [Gammaproteobacteria bacterium]